MYRYLLLFTLALTSFTSLANTNEDKSFYALLDEIWEYEISVSPLLASRQGDNSQNNKLPDISPQGLATQYLSLIHI